MEKVVFDANALLSYLYAEKNYKKIGQLLLKFQKNRTEMFISTVNFGEMHYSVLRNSGKEKAAALKTILESIPIEIVPVYTRDSEEAAEIKAYKRMSYADCYAAALAQRLAAPIITGDPEFKEVEKEIRIIWV